MLSLLFTFFAHEELGFALLPGKCLHLLPDEVPSLSQIQNQQEVACEHQSQTLGIVVVKNQGIQSARTCVQCMAQNTSRTNSARHG